MSSNLSTATVVDDKRQTDPDQIDVSNAQLARYLEEIDFENLEVGDLLKWADQTFPGRAVISTSLQRTGIVLIHLASELGLKLRVATVDTWRLHRETHEFLEEIEKRYDCDVERVAPEQKQVVGMVERFGEYLFFDSKEKQEYCCQVRKTRPHHTLLKTAGCWIAGVRRDQSVHRAQHTPKASLVPEYGTRRLILKLNPLADWAEKRLLQFVEANGVPEHPLYAKGYKSIGCFICSTPAVDGEDQRAGRWRWFNQKNRELEEDAKECGLHYNI
jgi:phosphoadenosine phosphosulfate reductase